jgi:hypothetical protein
VKRVDATHIIYAYVAIVQEKEDEGMSAAEIREWLREEWSLAVGVQAVKSVMTKYGWPRG